MRSRFSTILFFVATLTSAEVASAEMVTVEQRRLLVRVDVQKARWSAQLKGTEVRLGDISFLPDDGAGWSITHEVDNDESSPLGAFVTVTLRGTKPGELEFDYRLSVSKTGNDIVVQLGRANRTGETIKIDDMDYLVVNDAQLGGTIDRWLSFGVKSLFDEYHDLTLVKDFGDSPETSKRMYEVCHLVRHAETGNVILMGHLTVHKGHSRFEFAKTTSSTSMKARAYCHFDVSVPSGASFAGEKLLVHLGHDGIRGLEHLGDLIALANDVRLKERRPLDFENRALIGCAHCRWIHWMAGGRAEQADRFIKENGLDKFYYTVVEHNPQFGGTGCWGLCYSGGRGKHALATQYPPECYLRYKIRWGDGRVLDFSHPMAVECERKRVAEFFRSKKDKVVWGRLDFAELWRKWPKQKDQFLSAAETWRLAAAPWRDAVDNLSPGSRNRSCMTRVDFNYGLIDIARTSQDADGNYVPGSYSGPRAFLGESAPGTTMRFFYNSRVFWNDCDNIHLYKYDKGRIVSYGEAKVRANFHAIAGSTMYPSEAFDVPYPADRIELLKRTAPPTADAAYPVDLFVRNPAQIWSLPIERRFGTWNIVAVFNFGPVSNDFTAFLDAKKDLRLDPAKTYLVYEFWSRQFLGTFRGTFRSRAIPQKDCDVYCVVEKKDRPVLVSTSRHVRQMAFDIKFLAWHEATKQLHGVSRAVRGDPYQLRIAIPDGYRFKSLDLPDGLKATTTSNGPLVIIEYTTATDKDVSWTVGFRASEPSHDNDANNASFHPSRQERPSQAVPTTQIPASGNTALASSPARCR